MNLLFEPFRPASVGAGSARKIALAVCCLAALMMNAGCSSPESSIKENCIRNGGFTGQPTGDTSRPTGIVERQCACFANRMKDTLADDQLKAVAAALERPDHAEALKALPPATVTAIMGASKSCARPST